MEINQRYHKGLFASQVFPLLFINVLSRVVVTCYNLKIIKIKQNLKIQFLSCSRHISSAQLPQVPGGYHIEQHRSEYFHHCRKFYWIALLYKVFQWNFFSREQNFRYFESVFTLTFFSKDNLMDNTILVQWLFSLITMNILPNVFMCFHYDWRRQLLVGLIVIKWQVIHSISNCL